MNGYKHTEILKNTHVDCERNDMCRNALNTVITGHRRQWNSNYKLCSPYLARIRAYTLEYI